MVLLACLPHIQLGFFDNNRIVSPFMSQSRTRRPGSGPCVSVVVLLILHYKFKLRKDTWKSQARGLDMTTKVHSVCLHSLSATHVTLTGVRLSAFFPALVLQDLQLTSGSRKCQCEFCTSKLATALDAINGW